MTENPLILVLMIAASLYMIHVWRSDYQAAKAGAPHPRALPGATPASLTTCVIAAIGALIILAAETLGEIQLGLSAKQSSITVLFGIYTLVAAFIEELIFRGFIVIEGRGPKLRWIGIVAASVLFAALHPFLWEWKGGWLWVDGRLELTLTAKGWFSTVTVFLSSLWFYTVRFARFNPQHSLLPCFTAHATKNLGVFAIKAAQGFLIGWW
jgi:membrane protease YdiL (CAAX protease family)